MASRWGHRNLALASPALYDPLASLCFLDAQRRNLYTTLMPCFVRSEATEIALGGSMDIVFLSAAALMVAAVLGMVIGCDTLGVRK